MTTQQSLRSVVRVVLFAFALSLSACTGILDEIPVNAIGSATAYANETRINNLVNGVYDAFGNGNFAGGRLVVYGSIRGADLENRTENNVTARNTYAGLFNANDQEILGCWQLAYLTINRANDLIEGLVTNASKVSGNKATVWTAEVRFLRGLSYLYLVNLYAQPFHTNASSPGVPLRLKFENNAQNNNLARATVSEVYAQIQADLEFAANNLPAANGADLSGGPVVNKATRKAALAALVRMHLYKQEYAQAQARALEYTGGTAGFTSPAPGVVHAMATTPVAPFNGTASDLENIFAVGVGPNDLPGTQNSLSSYYGGQIIIGDYFVNRRSPSGVGALNGPSGIWADSVYNVTTSPGAWLTTDTRRAARASNGWTLVNSGQTWVYKWFLNPATDHVQVLRHAEVMLTAAETRCRLNPGAVLTSGAGAEALAYYNAVRSRSNGGVNRTAAQLNDNTNTLLTAIMQERRIEFLGEGHEYYDLRRTSQPLPTKTYAAGVVPAIAYGANAYIWPLPQQEINSNRLATQNPGF